VGFLAWRGGTSGAKSAGRHAQVTGGPKLSVDRDSIDFGKLPLDIPVKAEFKLKNVGDQPLAIKGEPASSSSRGVDRLAPSSVRRHSTQDRKRRFRWIHDARRHGWRARVRVHVLTSDPKEPEKLLTVISFWVSERALIQAIPSRQSLVQDVANLRIGIRPFRLFYNAANGAID